MPFNACRAAAIALLMGVSLAEGAPAAKGSPGPRTDCDAFGRIYRDGETFTISTGLEGATTVHVCTHGTWKQYDGSLWQSLHHR
jgi:hypothetical protein